MTVMIVIGLMKYNEGREFFTFITSITGGVETRLVSGEFYFFILKKRGKLKLFVVQSHNSN